MALAMGGIGGLNFGRRVSEPPPETTFPRDDAGHLAAAEAKRQRKATRKAMLTAREKGAAR